ncbi:LysR family transcriptional regulator [Methylocella sp.]|uniref:LysR family transcriptional regulator n=1 Tax=Methylocella sp. TaxID=1978226 RepID=UPI003784880B
MAIDTNNLSHVDLNLLVALDALLTERSVTRAAARIGLKQSAMSHNLARLRALFGDELLTRYANGMRLTPRALALIDPLRGALSQIEAIVAREDAFNPATSERVFRIGLPDSSEVLHGPALLAHLLQAAPHVRLRLFSIDSLEILDDLDADRLDLAIGVGGAFVGGQAHHKRRLLVKERYLCMFNAALVGVEPPISLDDYVRLPHVLTSLRKGERGVVDDALEALGRRRTVALTTSRFLAVPFLVQGAPVVTTMHSRLARFFAGALGLSLSLPPVELPEAPISLLWHASYDRDPAHVWLRGVIADLFAERGDRLLKD